MTKHRWGLRAGMAALVLATALAPAPSAIAATAPAQVMAYYWITQAQLYIQSLGFGSTLAAVNRRQVPVRINQFGGDNSFFRDAKTDITYGKGGVDDAEDAEVIVHEYGHSVQHAQVPGFGPSPDSGAIGEGFSDYLAVTVSAAGAPRPRPSRASRTGTRSPTPSRCRTACGAWTARRSTPRTWPARARSMPTVRSGRARSGRSGRRSAPSSRTRSSSACSSGSHRRSRCRTPRRRSRRRASTESRRSAP